MQKHSDGSVTFFLDDLRTTLTIQPGEIEIARMALEDALKENLKYNHTLRAVHILKYLGVPLRRALAAVRIAQAFPRQG